jgi:hypothetical protein
MDGSMFGGSLASTARHWRAALAKQAIRIRARNLYAGRSFAEANRVAALTGADLYVVSAGLGVVSADDEVPAYDLTVTASPGGLNSALARHSATPADWWANLCDGAGLAELISANAHSLVLLALPSSYARMIAADLVRLSEKNCRRLRIFTSPVGRAEIPCVLQPSTMPYDERLESLPPWAGTRADFPQRALRHFVECLGGHRLELGEARRAVETALSTCGIRHIPMRTRISDDEVRRLIRRAWIGHEGKASRLLRFLRDEAQVACEQGRFAELWREVREEMNA